MKPVTNYVQLRCACNNYIATPSVRNREADKYIDDFALGSLFGHMYEYYFLVIEDTRLQAQ